jgi:hypothetical protein
MLYSSINYAGRGALYGFLIVLSGVPVYWISRRMGKGSEPRRAPKQHEKHEKGNDPSRFS